MSQTSTERSYSEIVGRWLARHGENVEDMGHRVAEVLTRDPGDHHYAGAKLAYALTESAQACALAGHSEDDLIEMVQAAHRRALEDAESVRRELVEDRHS